MGTKLPTTGVKSLPNPAWLFLGNVVSHMVCDMCFVFSWPENHNMHHRTSTESMHRSMCDMHFCILLARKSQRASSHIESLSSTDSIHLSMCDMCFCILLARKSQHASSHTRKGCYHISRVQTHFRHLPFHDFPKRSTTNRG